MESHSSLSKNGSKKDVILRAAKKLFLENGYENTTVRQIVQEANSSMGNLYFHFPNKFAILKAICRNFVDVLREQIYEIRGLSLPPEVGFALDFRLGYINTLEHPKLSQLWLLVRNLPEIHEYSLRNKKIRLRTFFNSRLSPEEIDSMAVAIQGIADAFFHQKQLGKFKENSSEMSNAIIDYSLRLLGYSQDEINNAITKVEQYINDHHLTVDEYFRFDNLA